MREFTAVSLFCDAGGLDMGFDREGFKSVWASPFVFFQKQTRTLRKSAI